MVKNWVLKTLINKKVYVVLRYPFEESNAHMNQIGEYCIIYVHHGIKRMLTFEVGRIDFIFFSFRFSLVEIISQH